MRRRYTLDTKVERIDMRYNDGLALLIGKTCNNGGLEGSHRPRDRRVEEALQDTSRGKEEIDSRDPRGCENSQHGLTTHK